MGQEKLAKDITEQLRKPEWQERFFALAVLVALFQLPSLRAIFKYTPESLLPVVSLTISAASIGFYFILLGPPKSWTRRFIRQSWLSMAILVVASLAIIFIYPIADGLKEQMRGSDQDDCVKSTAMALWSGEHFYDRTYVGNLCSTGPGIAILYFPFVAVGLYPLGMIVALAGVAAMLRWQEGNATAANAFISIFFSTILSWELGVVGSDLPMIGCSIALTALLLEKALREKGLALLLVASLICGLAASARINLMYLPLLLACYAFPQWRFGAFFFLLFAAIIAIVPGAWIYAANPDNFTPLHLLGKAQRILSPTLIILGSAASVAAALWGLLQVRRDPSRLTVAILASMTPSLLLLSLGDLASTQFNLAAWEGANYIMPILPVASVVAARFVSRAMS